jgi:hypothetical protein
VGGGVRGGITVGLGVDIGVLVIGCGRGVWELRGMWLKVDL